MINNRKNEERYQRTGDLAADIVRMCAYHRSHECLMDDETYFVINHASDMLRAYNALKDAVGRFLDREDVAMLTLDATAPVYMALGRVLTTELRQ